MNVGYARVSTRDQDRELQLRDLRAAGCERIFEETASGARSDRPRLAEALDYARAGGKLVFHVFGALAEFERDLIRERTQAGLEAARTRGRKGGRKPKLDRKKLQLASSMLQDRSNSVGDVCTALGVSRATLYRHLRPDGTPRTEIVP